MISGHRVIIVGTGVVISLHETAQSFILDGDTSTKTSSIS